mmetsp:Transcript_16399/g.27785  ORF Transcript_16399/g.27785 Transcript_16399/m.27785 type:complete len:383 (+) Transcript_16399:126-1274(+)
MGERAQQIPFYCDGSYLCEPCAELCRTKVQRQKPVKTKAYKFNYQCQCKFMRGGCKLRYQGEEGVVLSEEERSKQKEDYKKYLNEKLLMMAAREVPLNRLNQQQFEFSLESNLENAMLYDDEITRAVALSCIPPEIVDLASNPVQQLKELVNWFKFEFFSWCDKPPCPSCKSDQAVERVGSDTPNAEDREYHASQVEKYLCKNCKTTVRFPRYNHPMKLFETRTGRCGEWANAFTCLCIALGHDARKVLDWTDHVWTEVYLAQWERWVHIDACEPLFDKPLTYEKGWGKELTYCIAFSSKEMVDVSKRYVVDPVLNRMRRDRVNEKWLADTLQQRREALWSMQGDSQAQFLRKRYQIEQGHLDAGSAHKFPSEPFQPRQSGA